MGTVLGCRTRQQDTQGSGRPIGGTPGCWFPSQALQACGGELSPAAALEPGWRVSGSRGIPANSWLVSGGRLPARGASPSPWPRELQRQSDPIIRCRPWVRGELVTWGRRLQRGLAWGCQLQPLLWAHRGARWPGGAGWSPALPFCFRTLPLNS